MTAAADRDIYYNDRATGGGAIQDALTHLINAVEWLAGPISRLAADAGHLVLPGVDVEDSVNVIARHGRGGSLSGEEARLLPKAGLLIRKAAGGCHDGVLASYSLNQHQAPDEMIITVICAHGTARCELHRYRWLSSETRGERWHVESEYRTGRDALFIVQAERFLDAIEGATTVACSLDEGLQTLKAILAVLEAFATQTWQMIR